ncbi:unnamed protein product, partial [Meganyctiphanes norvegica]
DLIENICDEHDCGEGGICVKNSICKNEGMENESCINKPMCECKHGYSGTMCEHVSISVSSNQTIALLLYVINLFKEANNMASNDEDFKHLSPNITSYKKAVMFMFKPLPS